MGILITNAEAGLAVVSFTASDKNSQNVLIHAYCSHYNGDEITIVDTLSGVALAGEAGSNALTAAINKQWPTQNPQRMIVTGE